MAYRSSRASASKPSFSSPRLSLAGLLLLAGCGEALKPFTVVDRLRIGAMASEPVAYQGASPLEVKMLTLRSPTDETPVSVLMSGCILAGPVQTCGPGSLPLSLAGLPTVEVTEHEGQKTGARIDTWQFMIPAEARGPALIDAVVVNCDVGDNTDPQLLADGLAELLEKGSTPVPTGWTCAEDPLRMSRSVWIARHLVTPVDPTGPALVNLLPAPPVMERTEDQAELDAGLIRTEVSAITEGLVTEDEPRWFWFSSSPNGVVMRVSADEGGKTKALVKDARDELYSYWVIARDRRGRVGWNVMYLAPGDEIP